MDKFNLTQFLIENKLTENSRLEEIKAIPGKVGPKINQEEYMYLYIKDIAEEEGLDLDYRDEYERAFELALDMLQNQYPFLDYSDLIANKEKFWISF